MNLDEEALSRLDGVRTLDDLQREVTRLRDLLGVDHAVYHSVHSTGHQYALHTYSPAWAQRYMEREYARVDPVVVAARRRFAPVNWKALDWSSRTARELFSEAVECGVGTQGCSVPVRGPGGQFAMLTVSTRASDAEWERWQRARAPTLVALAHYVNQAALSAEGATSAPAVQPLSPREVDTLTLLAMGRSRGEAAEALSISEHTLRVYVEGARLKLGARNATHAVARALTEGLVTA